MLSVARLLLSLRKRMEWVGDLAQRLNLPLVQRKRRLLLCLFLRRHNFPKVTPTKLLLQPKFLRQQRLLQSQWRLRPCPQPVRI